MTTGRFEHLAATTAAAGARLDVLDEVDSTNTYLINAVREHPQDWAPGDAVIAWHQAAGKGRAGRTWITPPGSAVTMTVLTEVTEPGFMPLVAGLAVHDVLAAAELNPGLKWPNDVVLPGGEYLDGWGRFRKVAGVLCELITTQEPDRPGDDARHLVAVGIGVNHSADPVEHSTSLEAAGIHMSLDDLAASVYRTFAHTLAEWATDPIHVHALVQQASITLGRRVEFGLGGRRVEGVAERIQENGVLQVRVGADLHQVIAGDVTLRM